MVLCSFAFISAQTPTQSAEAQKTGAEVVKLYRENKFQEALPLAKKAISLIENELGKKHLSLASAWRNLAYLQTKLNNQKEAETAFEKALSIYDDNQPLSSKDETLFAEMLEAVATYNALGGNLIGAEKRFLQAIEVREKISGKDSAELSVALSKLAEIYQLENNYEKAEPLLTRALNLSIKKDEKLSGFADELYSNLYCLLTKLNRETERNQLRERLYPKKPENTSDGKTILKPISGGVLNGKAISLSKPYYPAEAGKKRVGGAVSVQVLIDETGNVISACAVSGARELHRSSEWAALQAKFTPTNLQGKSVKVSGIITYNYVP